jgi:hypothetical protein
MHTVNAEVYATTAVKYDRKTFILFAPVVNVVHLLCLFTDTATK